MLGVTEKALVKRLTNPSQSRQKETTTYYVKDLNGYKVKVCKKYFLSTLGYTKNNDRILDTDNDRNNDTDNLKGTKYFS